MSASTAPLSTPEGPGSVSGAPNLPAGFTEMKPAAQDVQTVVIAGAGHWVAGQAPEEMLAALTPFLTPYRDGG